MVDLVFPIAARLQGMVRAVTVGEYLSGRAGLEHCAAYLVLVTRFDPGVHSLRRSVSVFQSPKGLCLRALENGSIPFTTGGWG